MELTQIALERKYGIVFNKAPFMTLDSLSKSQEGCAVQGSYC